MVRDDIEYTLISLFYGDKVAKRSQVPLMNHINEGLIVLDAIGASIHAKRAYCIHPLLQADEDLRINFNLVAYSCSPAVVMLAMEYRSVANEFLSDKIEGLQEVIGYYGIEGLDDDLVRLSPLKEVNDMLVADKVQNYKDFITYHKGTHPRSQELDDYFNIWLKALDISSDTYLSLCDAIEESKHET